MAYEGVGTATQVLTANAAGTLPSFQPTTAFSTGTFTPFIQIGGSSAGITYSAQIGQYTVIGNIVFFSWRVALTSTGGLSGGVTFNGFPFNSNATGSQTGMNDFQNFVFTGRKGLTAGAFPVSTVFGVDTTQSSGGNIGLTSSNVTNTSVFGFEGFYYTT